MNNSFGLVEDSCALLRRAPASAWALYLAGAAPYGVGLIWFWLETTRSAYAQQSLAWTSGALALLFIWKQVFEALFVSSLRALLNGRPIPPVRLPWLIVRQIAVQPTSLLAIPLALCAMIPVPYVLLFYRHFSLAAADGGEEPLGRSLGSSRSGSAASLWVLTAIAALAAILLYLNLLVTLVTAAQLAVSIFGVEDLNLGTIQLLSNSTVHFAVGVGVYLALDLLLDAAAVLQAFRAASVRSGEDILAALASVLLVLIALPLSAQTAPATNPADVLDHSIERTLQQPEFAWRLQPTTDDSPPFVAAIGKALRDFGRKLDEMIEAILRWLNPEDSESKTGPRGGGQPPVRFWLALFAVLTAVALAVFLYRGFGRRKPVTPAAREAAPAVDVRDESVLASRLPEDEWLRMAEDYLAQGEPRLALRALHLACLRVLSERGLISVTRSKTGTDYLDEVRRRSRQQPSLAERFRENIGIFELGWYSLHPVNPAMVGAYRAGLEQIRAVRTEPAL